MGFSPLNWKEIACLVRETAPLLANRYVERVLVPDRPRFPESFIKGEWAIRLGGCGQEDICILLSARPRKPSFAVLRGKGPTPSPVATRSGFDLAMNKHLKGARLIRARALPRERVIELIFQADQEYALFFHLIPALPEAWLAERARPDQRWNMLARSRNVPLGEITLPDGAQAPENLPVRDPLPNYEASLDEEAFLLRKQRVESKLREEMKLAKRRQDTLLAAIAQAEAEPDYQRLGDQLKSVLHERPRPIHRSGKTFWNVLDFETGEKTEIEGSPGLDARTQVERFYHLEKRKRRRLEEGEARSTQARDGVQRLESLKSTLPNHPSEPSAWSILEHAEATLGIELRRADGSAGAKRSKRTPWLGRSFRSLDGQLILVGKSREENLELTFNVARGNDVWLHLRGRPGAHVVIPIQPGKSASLETLLDAAVLAVFYSGGEKWGKTEVDYTFKKYVKRIKDSTEVSYTQNRTLIVEPDPKRLKRLLEKGV